jgi:GDP-4-dehydro-6-deoxy-D-mannose reductase
LKRVLLSGADGFIGSFLQPLLRNHGYYVFAPPLAQLNLLNKNSIEETIGTKAWDIVIHLAGMSHVIECEKNPDTANAINTGGTKHLVDCLLSHSSGCHFVFASTAQVYQAPHGLETRQGIVFDENRGLVPQNSYAQTKWEAEKYVHAVAQSGKLNATVLRLFNHTHKTQAPNFFLPHIYSQMVSGSGSEAVRVPVGNLDLARDIGSVRDLVRAVLAVLEKRSWPVETFNICSGRPRNLRSLATQLAARLDVQVEFFVDPSRVRPGEPLSIIGSHEKITRAVGWRPRIQTDAELIDDFLSDEK